MKKEEHEETYSEVDEFMQIQKMEKEEGVLLFCGEQGTTSFGFGQALCVGFYLCEGMVKESSAVQ